MWDFLQRQQLQRKGFSCGRKRREQNQSEWLETLRFSPFVRYLFLAAFLAGMGALVGYLPENSGFQYLQALPEHKGMGSILMVVLLTGAMLHLKLEQPCTWERNSRVLLVFFTILLQITLVYLADFLIRHNAQNPLFALYFAPCALAPMTLTLLMGKEHGFFAAIYSTAFGALIVSKDHSLAFIVLSLVAGIVGMVATQRLRKRSQLMRAGLWVGLASMVACAVLGLMEPWFDAKGSWNWHRLGIDAGCVLASGIFTAMIVNGLLPMLEGLFRITTTISWIELSDLNHPLLRRMTLEAPGTYHHSLMVAALAENAAQAIGADSTLCRVCSLFHDIGKLERPEYCIENIHGDENPHDAKTPRMSALIIISHVKDGVDLAIKHKLCHEIIDIIQQHHGTSLVYFFYRRALDHQEEMKQQLAAGKVSATDVPEVSESDFRYPGPKPQTRESAIISLADAVEGASRVLQKPTPQRIEQLVDEIFASRLRDGQLDECDLTLADLNLIRESFCNSLRVMGHRRIQYPEEREKTRDKDAKTSLESRTPTVPLGEAPPEKNSAKPKAKKLKPEKEPEPEPAPAPTAAATTVEGATLREPKVAEIIPCTPQAAKS